jgi:pimeloyl-ACP methyl ester carboxylesterase
MARLAAALTLVGTAAIAGIGWTAVSFRHDMAQARAAVLGRSNVVETAIGRVEYSLSGSGPPVLVIHGSGGGFDQGELLARAALGAGYTVIAPSRFGYLRSALPPGARFDEQAQAYAQLLDRLGIERVAVLAFSHGGPSALLLAALHPERVQSLTLISAGVASSSAPEQGDANARGAMLARMFQLDFAYWAATRLMRSRILALMGADEDVVARLEPLQRRLVDELVDGMNPVSLRSAGAGFDNTAAMPNERIAAITAPTLVVHARDDRLQRFDNAEAAMRSIPSARLLAFDRGGHLVLAVEQRAVRQAVADHLQSHGSRP